MRWCRSSRPRRSDPEIGGQFAAIGIVKGKKFDPDARMRKILTDAIAIANAAGRTVSFRAARIGRVRLLRPDVEMAAIRCSSAATTSRRPPPEITKEGVKPFPYTGARTLDARTAFFYVATGVTPAMVMRLPEHRLAISVRHFRCERRAFDGAKTYKVTLPPNIPAAKFWSFTVYDNQTRSMLQTAAAVPARRQPKLPEPGGRAERRRLDDGLFRSDQARGRQATAIGSRPCPAKAGS